ncbi:MAG: methionyl-tRNA formyltransferase [Solirubrobacterales bacterium]
MRNVYLGTSEFAASVLERLAGSTHRPALVVTRPARPKGRGRSLHDPPVAEAADALGIECFQPADVNDAESVERIRVSEPTALTVCAYGAIVKEPLLSAWPIFNVHPSLLPRWRGAAPIERAIANCDQQTGVSIMRLVEALDAGPVCAQQAVPVGDRNYGDLASELADLGGEMLVKALDAHESGTIAWTDQDELGGEAAVTYAEKIERDDRVLKPSSTTAGAMIATIRALTPHVGAVLPTVDGGPLRVEDARLADAPVPSGEAVELDGRLLVGASDGAIELLQVKPAGGKTMDVESYLRGNDVPQLA